VKISINTISYQSGQYLSQTINSVLSQTYQNWEWIIIDDCSTDNTELLIDSIKDSRIRYFRNEVNSGICYSRNRALQNSTGDFIAVLDADDIWMNHHLENAVGAFLQNGNLELYGSPSLKINKLGELFEEGSSIKKWVIPSQEISVQLFFQNCFTHSSTVFKRDLIRNGGYSIEMAPVEDYHLFQKLADINNCFIGDKPSVYYRVSQDSVSNTSESKIEKNLLRIYSQSLTRFGFEDELFINGFYQFIHKPGSLTLSEAVNILDTLILSNNKFNVFDKSIFLKYVIKYFMRYLTYRHLVKTDIYILLKSQIFWLISWKLKASIVRKIILF